MPSQTPQFAFALFAAVTLPSVANARPASRHRATDSVSDHVRARNTDDDACHDTGRTVAAGVGEHVEVIDDTFLRPRIGRDSSDDRTVAAGIRVVVRAVDRANHALLVEDPRGQFGWVSPCEIAGVARQVNDVVAGAASAQRTARPPTSWPTTRSIRSATRREASVVLAMVRSIDPR